jgi:contractile injection system tube protein
VGTQPPARAADNAAMNRTPFSPAFAKLTIGSLDDHAVEVEAQYNPHELAVDKQVAWHDKPRGDDVEHAEAPKRSMTIEFLFDGFERGESVDREIAVLEKLSDIRTDVPPLEHHRRPHHCVVVWGDRGIRAFRCVIEALTVKYTMFDRFGAPLRASCTVKLREAALRDDGELAQRAAARTTARAQKAGFTG